LPPIARGTTTTRRSAASRCPPHRPGCRHRRARGGGAAEPARPVADGLPTPTGEDR
jgi:hypothetical protein